MLRRLSFRRRFVLAFTVIAGLGVSSSVNAAGAVLAPNGTSTPAYVHVRVALAASAAAAKSTRWIEVTVPPHERAMWLVPVRPGARVDVAIDPWLDALDRATTPHVLPPDETPSCDAPRAVDRTDPWTEGADATRVSTALSTSTVAATAADAVARATERGYVVAPDLEARIDLLYRSGWQLLALELGASSTVTTSETLRVTDDGGPVLPLAITGGASVRVTAFTIGPGVASAPRTAEIDPSDLRWGSAGSNYEALRRARVEDGDAWLREAASHDVLFEGIRSPGVEIPSVIDAYFDAGSCRDGVRATGKRTDVVDASELTCAKKPDLALALAGSAPRKAVLTRWSAAVREGSFASNVAFEFSDASPQRAPLFRASSYETCEVVTVDPPPRPAPEEPAMSEGCGGSVVVPVSSEGTEEEGTSSDDGSSDWSDLGSDDACEGEDCPSDDTSASDGCSHSTDDGSDDGDEDGSDGWDDEDDDDGWDTEDGMSPSSKNVRPKAKSPHPAKGKTSKNKKRSPVSRVALFGAALLLPLRRRRHFAKT